MAWTISFDPRAQKDLFKLDQSVQRKIIRYLEARVAGAVSPELLGKPLSGPLAGFWRYRVENFRVICRIESAQVTVLVLAIGHRKDVYARLP